ncbi:hypothetical protein N431DRAFT_558647 [Stipitochalara longipes BDJ]|nr:hypothetical protein N431DRAFT_558647 [Stipitochalara longipes BDJ]
MSNYAHYQNATGYPLVKQQKIRRAAHWDGSTVYTVTDTFCEGYYWKLILGMDNTQGGGDKEYEVTETSQTVNKNGSGWSIGAEIGAEFKGVSVKISGEYKQFNETETTHSTTKKVKHTVKAGRAEYYYQKVYKFRTRTICIYDAWGEMWILCRYNRNDYPRIFLNGFVDIETESFVVKNQELRGVSTVYVEDTVPNVHAWNTYKGRKGENVNWFTMDWVKRTAFYPAMSGPTDESSTNLGARSLSTKAAVADDDSKPPKEWSFDTEDYIYADPKYTIVDGVMKEVSVDGDAKEEEGAEGEIKEAHANGFAATKEALVV